MTLTADDLRPVLSAHGIALGDLIERRPLTVCFRGTLSSSGSPVFIKALHSDIPKVQAHFAREIGILHELRGRAGIPDMHAASGDAPLLFHACAYLVAPRLDHLIGDGHDSLDGILRIGGMLARWICQLHGTDIAHQDLSPDHVFLGPGSSLTVVDFGMAKRTRGLSSGQRLLCHGYDIQAFGMMLWELICGRPLFDYRAGTLPGQLRAEIAIIRDVSLPAPIGRLITDCLCASSELTPEGVASDEPIGSAEELSRRLQELGV